MILFSTVNQPLILWLFCYLGFASGLVFFTVFNLSNIIREKKILKKNVTKMTTEKNLKKKKSNNKFLKNCKKMFNFCFKYFSIILSVLTFLFVLLISYYLNLLYNYGEVTFVNIVFYCFAFTLANIFLKTLAKFMNAFYNDKRLKGTK